MTEYKWPTDLDFLVLKINTQDMTDYAGLFNDSADIQLTLKWGWGGGLNLSLLADVVESIGGDLGLPLVK